LSRAILAVLLLWVLEHIGRGLGAHGITEHLNLSLHCIDGSVVVVQAVLHGGVSRAKVVNSISQGGCRCIVLYNVLAISVLQGQGRNEGCNVDGSLPKGTECGKVHCVGWVVAARDPGLIFFHKEAHAMDDTNTDVNDVIVRDGMLGEVGKVPPRNRRVTRSSNPCDGCQSTTMAVQLTLGSSADVRPYFATNQAKILQKMELGFSIRICSYDCLKATGIWDKVKESINEGRVHDDDIDALLECHAMGDFDIGMIIGAGASTVVGHISDFRGKWIVLIRACLAAGIVSLEGGIDGNVQEIYLFGYGGLVHLGTFTKVLEEIVEDGEVEGAQAWFRWCWECKAHTGSQGFRI
jgi:hypothetical protein